ncbi:uncharacterized protein [Diadema antillarum]|uniref:uncharacterized protein n=1 Tax=Diadema antillarum TaxID=105358 RepID=UPI003A838988
MNGDVQDPRFLTTTSAFDRFFPADNFAFEPDDSLNDDVEQGEHHPGKGMNGTPRIMLQDDDEDDEFRKKPPSETLSKMSEKYSYPDVCSYCHKLWDKTGTTEMISPCECPRSKLHVHESCLKTWLKESGKVRCRECNSAYSDQKEKQQRAESVVQQANMCIIVVLMPLGTVMVVTACLLLDTIRSAQAKRAAGEETDYLGIPPVSFGFLMIFMFCLILLAVCATRSFMGGNNNNNSDEMMLSKI